MSAYIQTRGHSSDYAFIGLSPTSQWWRDYRTITAFEDPTILVERDGNSWRCLVSAIPSARRDRVGTVIRYTIVLDGACGGASDSAHAKQLIEVATDAATHQPAFATLTSLLDDCFPKEFIEDCFARRDDAEVAKQVQQRLETALLALPTVRPVAGSASAIPESWLGSVFNDNARREFVRRSHAIIDASASGRACVLNLIDSADDASSLLTMGGPVAMLATVGANHFGPSLIPLVQKKKHTEKASNAPARPPSRLKTILFAGLAMLLVALGIWFVTQTQSLRLDSSPATKTDSPEKPASN